MKTFNVFLCVWLKYSMRPESIGVDRILSKERKFGVNSSMFLSVELEWVFDFRLVYARGQGATGAALAPPSTTISRMLKRWAELF